MKLWILLFAFWSLFGGNIQAIAEVVVSVNSEFEISQFTEIDAKSVGDVLIFNNSQTHVFDLGMFFGVVLILLIYSFLIFVNVKQPVFLWYFIYTFLVSAYLLTNEGILFDFNPIWLKYFAVVNSGFVFFAFKSFFQLVLDTKNQYGLEHRIMNQGFIIGIGVLALQLIFPYSLVIILLGRLVIVAVVLIIFYLLVIDKTQSPIQSNFLKISIVALFISGLAFSLESFFPEHQMKLMVYGFSFTVVHIITYSVAILFRIKLLSDKKELLWHEIRQSKNELLQAYFRGIEEEKNRITNELNRSVLKEIEVISDIPEIANSGFTPILDRLKQDIHVIASEWSENNKTQNSGLIKNIEDLVESHNENENKIVFKQFNYMHKLESKYENHLFRIVQEAIQNAEKYAKANVIEIQIYQNESNFILTIEDDGIGFDSKKKGSGIGIKNMENRVSEMNGSFNLASSSGKGVSILIAIGDE
jgi:two-component sensor histidine kinase